jgi:hypothetical protein
MLEAETLLKPMKNLSCHTYLLCELETSLMMRGIQIGEMSKLSWLIALNISPVWIPHISNEVSTSEKIQHAIAVMGDRRKFHTTLAF